MKGWEGDPPGQKELVAEARGGEGGTNQRPAPAAWSHEGGDAQGTDGERPAQHAPGIAHLKAAGHLLAEQPFVTRFLRFSREVQNLLNRTKMPPLGNSVISSVQWFLFIDLNSIPASPEGLLPRSAGNSHSLETKGPVLRPSTTGSHLSKATRGDSAARQARRQAQRAVLGPPEAPGLGNRWPLHCSTPTSPWPS